MVDDYNIYLDGLLNGSVDAFFSPTVICDSHGNTCFGITIILYNDMNRCEAFFTFPKLVVEVDTSSIGIKYW